MLVRYRTDYRSPLRWLRPCFRRDHRALRGCLRQPGRLSVEAATHAVEQALAVRRLRESWSELAPALESQLGSRYLSLDSDWASIEADLRTLSSVYEQFSAAIVRRSTRFSRALSRFRADSEARLVEQGLVWLESTWKPLAFWSDQRLSVIVESLREYLNAAVRLQESVASLGIFVRRPGNVAEFVNLLQSAVSLHQVETRAERATGALAETLGPYYGGWKTDLDRLIQSLEWTQESSDWCRHHCPALSSCGEAGRLAYGTRGAASMRSLKCTRLWRSRPTPPATRVTLEGTHRFRACCGPAWCDNLANARSRGWLEYRRRAASTIESRRGGRAIGVPTMPR